MYLEIVPDYGYVLISSVIYAMECIFIGFIVAG